MHLPKKRGLATVSAASEPQICEQPSKQLNQQDKSWPRDLQSSGELVIVISPHAKRAGVFKAWLERNGRPLCVSRAPLLKSARVLFVLGVNPTVVLKMRHAHSDTTALSGQLGVVAKLTVDEHNGTVFAKWHPFSSSTVSALSALNAPSATGVASPSVQSTEQYSDLRFETSFRKQRPANAD